MTTMTTGTRIWFVGLLVAALIGGGAWLAMAQDATNEPAPADNDDAATAEDGDAAEDGEEEETDLYSFEVKDLNGETVELSQYEGKVVLIVNTASRCGFTPQYGGLQTLYEAKKDDGLVILGFPCNDFGNQEPGSAEEIEQFCEANYGVSFPMMEKVQVRREEGRAPLYQWLVEQTEQTPNWNFCKYLVGKDGTVRGFYNSRVTPDSDELTEAINAALGEE